MFEPFLARRVHNGQTIVRERDIKCLRVPLVFFRFGNHLSQSEDTRGSCRAFIITSSRLHAVTHLRKARRSLDRDLGTLICNHKTGNPE